MQLSIIIPVYNEQDKIGATIEKLFSFLQENKVPFKEVIVTEDGSTDRTVEIVNEKAKKLQKLKIVSRDGNKGRDYALNCALAEASGDVVIYMDVDLATDLKHISQAVAAINSGADIALGSRYALRNEAYRSFSRIFVSKFYNFFVIWVLGSHVLDHQCGFKAFRRSAIVPLLPKVKDLRWFWDTELVVRAQRAGLKVAEFPVKWHEGQATKVKIVRDSLRMMKSILKLRLELFNS